MKIASLLAPALGVFAVAVIVAQPRGPNPPFPGFAGASGRAGPIVTNEVKHDVSPAVRDMEEATTGGIDFEEGEAGEADLRHPSQSKGLTPISMDAVLQQFAGPLVATSPGLNFDVRPRRRHPGWSPTSTARWEPHSSFSGPT